MKNKLNEQTSAQNLNLEDLKTKCKILQGTKKYTTKDGNVYMTKIADVDSTKGNFKKGDTLVFKKDSTFDVLSGDIKDPNTKVIKTSIVWKCIPLETTQTPTGDKEQNTNVNTNVTTTNKDDKKVEVKQVETVDDLLVAIPSDPKSCRASLSKYMVVALQGKQVTNKPKLVKVQNSLNDCYRSGSFNKFVPFTKSDFTNVASANVPTGFLNMNLRFNEVEKLLKGEEVSNSKIQNSKYWFNITNLGQRSVQNENNKKMKNIIRENLEKVIKTKKNDLVNENKIIKSRYSILVEGVEFKSESDYRKLCDNLINETIYLKSQRFNNNLINEQLLSFLGGLPFGTGITEYFKEQFLKWVAGKMGAPTDGFLFGVLQKAFGNIELRDYPKLLECSFLTRQITDAFAEQGLAEIEKRTVGTGAAAEISRNMMMELFKSSEVHKVIETAIGKYVCPSLSGISSKMQTAMGGMTDKLTGSGTPATT